MKLSSLGYLIKEGFRSIKQNSFMSIASVLVLVSCLLLTGASYLVFVNVESGFRWAFDQNKAVVWAVETATDEDVEKLKSDLLALNNISDVVVIPKEQILQDYAADIHDATFEQLQGENNPMLDALEVTFIDLDQAVFQATITQIGSLANVDDITYHEEVSEVLTKIRSAVLTIGGWIIVMLLLVSLFIISNTIKLTVYSRRLEIGIMKSVGATKMFIRLPFMVEGMVLGFAAGLLSFGVLYFVYTQLLTMGSVGFISLVPMYQGGLIPFMSIPVWLELLIGFLLIGTLTGMLGSRHAIGRYLKEGGVSVD